MAKTKSSAPKQPSKQEQMKWRAEDIVRQSIMSTPAFKKAVRQTMTELKKIDKEARKTISEK